jgi:hypothetical protein
MFNNDGPEITNVSDLVFRNKPEITNVSDLVFRNKSTNKVIQENYKDLSGENHIDLKSR